MSQKINKCSDSEIYNLLVSDATKKIPVIKLQKIPVKSQSTLHNQNKRSNSSDSEELFEPKETRSKSTNKRDGKGLLKIKLKRGSEQDDYEIHNDSEHNSYNGKNKKENNDPSEAQMEGISPRRTERLRNRPKILDDYECQTFSNLNSPRRGSRKIVNYNIENMFREIDKLQEEEIVKKNKRTHTSTRDIENINSKQPRKLSKQSSKVLSDNERNIESAADVQFQNIVDTPKKASKRISHIRLNSEVIDENNSDVDGQSTLLTKKTRHSGRNKISMDQNNEADDEDEEINSVCSSITEMSIKKDVSTPQKKNNRLEQKILKNVKNTPGTPKVSVSIKCNNLTPSIGRRATLLVKPSTPLQQSRSNLHVSVVPKSLPCREEEFNNIFTFLEGKLMDKCGGCIYISGVPGTGKTATVNEVIRCLKRSVTKGKLDDFDFIEINGMKLTEPRQAYVQILKQLSGNTCTWEKAYHDLEKRFTNTNSKRPMTLLLVDELDLLCTKRQDVVYNLLDWPTKSSAKLVVITIANTMDLPERVLMGRVTSRLGLTRLTFQPYNHKQLQEIVITRLRDTDAFRSEAIQLVARKVSAVSGDARRALDICRRATEIAELHGKDKVSMEDVNKALMEMIVSSKVQAIKHCSQMEQIFLQAVCAEVTRTGIEESSFKNVYHQLCSICSFEGIKIPTVTETLAICGRLTASRLLICESTRMDIHQRILLNTSADDIHFALQPIDLK